MGHYTPITDDLFWSAFDGTLMGALHNKSNCEQEELAWAPVGIAIQATFLLETSTDYINEPETKSPSPSKKADPTPTDVLVDPFRVGSQSEDEQKPSQTKSDVEPGPTDAPPSPTVAIETKPAPDRPTSVVKQSMEASASPTDEISPLPNDDNQPKPSNSRATEPTASANEMSPSGDKLAASPKTSQLEILNSLIQDVGQKQSEVGSAASTHREVPTLVLDDVKATPDSSSEYVFNGQTLKAGDSAITISGTPISLASGASALVVGSSTSVLVASHGPAALLTLTAASEYVFGDQTVKPGGPAITVSGTPISLAPKATAVVVGSSTRPVTVVPYQADQTQHQSEEILVSLLTLAGATASLNSASEYIIAGQTLKAGGSPITISGTPISLASHATAVVVGSSTSILATAPRGGGQAQHSGKLAPVLTLAGATATLNSASEYVIGDQTLTPGENAITISGTRISLAPHATQVVIGSTTSAIPGPSSSGIGDYVWAGIAGVLAATEASSITSSVASGTESGSEVVATSTASDGEIVVQTIPAAGSIKPSATDFTDSSSGTSPLASGEGSSTSSSADASDTASMASTTRSYVDAAALICWIGFIMTFALY